MSDLRKYLWVSFPTPHHYLPLYSLPQPFGGEGLSGTGPKAGGSHYLYRFCAEQTVTVNTAAAGGNAALLAGH
jgi:delta 1-pyrroline-5-carboxylate dehydrogenase